MDLGKWYHSEGPYSEYNRQYECLLFYVDGLYREEVVFEICYEMNNAAIAYLDCSELYLSLYSGDTIEHLNSFKAQILVSDKDMPSSKNYNVYSYGTNDHTFPVHESTTMNPGYTTFHFELDSSDLKFKNYNSYIEFCLLSYGDDKDSFTTYSNKQYLNILSDSLAAQEEYESLQTNAIRNKILLFVLFLFLSYRSYNNFYKVKNKSTEKNPIKYPSVNYEFFRDIPSDLDPNFAAELVFIKDIKTKNDGDVYSAITLSLIRKKYIRLDKINPKRDLSFNNINIVITHVPTVQLDNLNNSDIDADPLSKTERLYFNLIRSYAKDNQITMKKFQSSVANNYTSTSTFIREFERSVVTIGTSQDYFDSANYRHISKTFAGHRNLCIIIGIIFLIFVNLYFSTIRIDFAYGAFTIFALVNFYNAYRYAKLAKDAIHFSQFGIDEYAKWRGLYNFLNSHTLMDEKTVIDVNLWEQYLIYATAFGISDKVSKALAIRGIQIPDNSTILRTSYYSSRSFRHHSRNFSSVARSTSSTYHSGGSSYGGGGRGGGGGGRWSLK